MTDRITARVVGALFLLADVTGVLAVAIRQTDIASMNASQVATSNLLIVAMALSVVGIAIVIYPVLERFGRRLAVAYVALRTMEGMVEVIGAIGGLTLLTVSQKYVGGAHDATLQTLGGVLTGQVDLVNNGILPIVFGLNALVLNYALYRSLLVPRWLSAWGLAGGAIWLAAGVMVTYGATSLTVLAVPIGLQEVALALWLIVQGFSANATSRTEDKTAARAA